MTKRRHHTNVKHGGKSYQVRDFQNKQGPDLEHGGNTNFSKPLLIIAIIVTIIITVIKLFM